MKREELRRYEEQGSLTLRVAFSRDAEQKRYVQHLLEEEAEAVWRLVDQLGAHVYVCGDAGKMAHDVHDTLVRIVMQQSRVDSDHQQQQHHDRAAAEKYLARMEKHHRYQRDVWAS